MRKVTIASPLLLGAMLVLASACDMGKLTVNTTSKVLIRAQPSLKGEADYELAARAIPGTLKTIEGFWVVSPDNGKLLGLLTEGYCQYGIGFVEDEWEEATFRHDLDGADYQSTRATKMFVRCMNYALIQLGKEWQEKVFADTETVSQLVTKTGAGKRTPMLWLAIALASAVNQNKDNIEIVAQFSTAKMILTHVLELDAKHPPKDPVLAALPHVGLGMIYSVGGAALGGNPDKATEHFTKALELTGDRFLLARVHLGKRVGVMTQNKDFFREQMLKVLQTDPAIWPEQRLANEIAHRRARRYIKYEKELF